MLSGSMARKPCIATVEDEIARGTSCSAIRIIDGILEHALSLRTSDVHFDPTVEGMIVRVRIDGLLREIQHIPLHMRDEVITRIKILAHVRTDEHFAAQDGRFSFHKQEGERVDIRVSILPTLHGENCVLRLLMNGADQFTLISLGFSHENRMIIERIARRPHGMILLTGPTGSGKTTTLYSLLKMLHSPSISIITIEDPVEYSIPGINQIPIHTRTGMTFGSSLRSVLRQDPDIIMVGEIRDAETAHIAVNAALTGHLLLSTMHTNDAPTAIPRLLDLKVDDFLIASTLNLVVAQRLVRRICSGCKTEYHMSSGECESLKRLLPDGTLIERNNTFIGKGCAACEGIGYRGRIGIHEVMEMTPLLRAHLSLKGTADSLRESAKREQMIPMVVDGWNKVQQGLTTSAEIIRMWYE